jgi:dolichol-phosphate mannosyltransferase
VTARSPSLAVVVPVYNEAATIERSVRSIAAAVEGYEGGAIVVAVDDGSADDSAEILERVAAEVDAVELVRHERNGGYGAALRTGARHARERGYDYAAFIDSDLTNPPEDLLVMARLAGEGHPYIKASRFVPGGTMASVPARRRLVSQLGNVVGAALFGGGLRDVTNGFRAVKLDVYEKWPLKERDFASIVEELYWARRSGVPVVEFATTLTARTGEQRVSAFPYSADLVRRYLRYGGLALVHRLRSRR